jgi:hypothetical protein
MRSTQEGRTTRFRRRSSRIRNWRYVVDQFLSLVLTVFALIQPSENIFDNLPSLVRAPDTERDELDRYLNTETEMVTDALKWWLEKSTVFPHLSRMALDFLSIPGKSAMSAESVGAQLDHSCSHVR